MAYGHSAATLYLPEKGINLMLILRVLTLPIALTVLIALTAIAERAPETIATTSLVLWIMVPIALLFAAVRRYSR